MSKNWDKNNHLTDISQNKRLNNDPNVCGYCWKIINFQTDQIIEFRGLNYHYLCHQIWIQKSARRITLLVLSLNFIAIAFVGVSQLIL